MRCAAGFVHPEDGRRPQHGERAETRSCAPSSEPPSTTNSSSLLSAPASATAAKSSSSSAARRAVAAWLRSASLTTAMRCATLRVRPVRRPSPPPAAPWLLKRCCLDNKKQSANTPRPGGAPPSCIFPPAAQTSCSATHVATRTAVTTGPAASGQCFSVLTLLRHNPQVARPPVARAWLTCLATGQRSHRLFPHQRAPHVRTSHSLEALLGTHSARLPRPVWQSRKGELYSFALLHLIGTLQSSCFHKAHTGQSIVQ